MHGEAQTETRRRAASALGAVHAALLLTGCYLAHGRPDPTSPDAGFDAGRDAARDPHDGGRDAARPRDARPAPRDALPPRDAGAPVPMPCEDPQGVDFLLVLDDSGSIRPRDAQLRDRLRRLVHGLMRPPDNDLDGVEDWPRVTDLHVGVVSTSVRGTAFCDHVRDGRLMHEGADLPGCAREYPRYLTYVDGEGDPEALARDTICMGFGPREGCTVEQPLEAMVKALLPRSAPFSYVAGGAHGDGYNAGFLRPDSVLVVLLVGDEDDCSFRDPGIFEPPDAGPIDAGWDAGPLPIPGCLLARPDQMQPISRYEAALRWLRPRTDRVILGMIIGIEAGVVITGPLAEDPPGCFARVDYPRRMLQLARELPTQTVLGSVCGLSEMDVVHALARRITTAACED